MFRSAALTLTLCLATVTAQAALLGRAALTPGGTDYQAYYDTDLNITWLADTNYASTDKFGVTGYAVGFYGVSMQWSTALAWTAGMNTANFLGVNNWRLPKVMDTGAAGCAGYANGGTDCGTNVDVSTGEMAHMYSSTLGNVYYRNLDDSFNACAFQSSCLSNTGPFSHLRPDFYWSSTENAAYTADAWGFNFGGQQSPGDKRTFAWAWAVRDGDIAAVPIPPAVWLFGSALGLMGAMRRKVTA